MRSIYRPALSPAVLAATLLAGCVHPLPPTMVPDLVQAVTTEDGCQAVLDEAALRNLPQGEAKLATLKARELGAEKKDNGERTGAPLQPSESEAARTTPRASGVVQPAGGAAGASVCAAPLASEAASPREEPNLCMFCSCETGRWWSWCWFWSRRKIFSSNRHGLPGELLPFNSRSRHR